MEEQPVWIIGEQLSGTEDRDKVSIWKLNYGCNGGGPCEPWTKETNQRPEGGKFRLEVPQDCLLGICGQQLEVHHSQIPDSHRSSDAATGTYRSECPFPSCLEQLVPGNKWKPEIMD